jgi:hypothetical protein
MCREFCNIFEESLLKCVNLIYLANLRRQSRAICVLYGDDSCLHKADTGAPRGIVTHRGEQRLAVACNLLALRSPPQMLLWHTFRDRQITMHHFTGWGNHKKLYNVEAINFLHVIISSSGKDVMRTSSTRGDTSHAAHFKNVRTTKFKAKLSLCLIKHHGMNTYPPA